MYWIDLRQIFRIGRHIGEDVPAGICSVVVQVTLLW